MFNLLPDRPAFNGTATEGGLAFQENPAMSATVHRLFASLDRDNPPEAELPATAPPPQNPIIEAVKAATGAIALRQLQSMFEGADDALFGMSQRSADQNGHQESFDAMRRLRLERRRIEADFLRAFLNSFQVVADSLVEEFDLDRLAVMPTEELEEKIALGNLVAKAENLHSALLDELKLRIAHMIRDLGIPISRQALKPAVVCNAFKASLGTLDLRLDVRLLLYKLFDMSCVTRLQEIYRAALSVLDAQGVRPPVMESSTAEAAWSPYEAPPIPMESDQPLSIPVLDAPTRDALKAIGSHSTGHRPQDAQFAADLLLMASIDDASQATVNRVAPAQRMSLVGQMCNEILSDPHLPATMRPLFERLRFPLIKIAIADNTFFANRIHPVRRLVAEAAETAASSRIGSHAVVHRLEERLRQIADQIDLSATFVRPQVNLLQPLTMQEIASFLDQQREESESRRENVLNKVRRTVAQELEVHTLGRKPTPALINFLRVGWGPLMAARLLRHGMNSRQWVDATTRLTQLLAGMETGEVTPLVAAQREDICATIAQDLVAIGMRELRAETAVGYLRVAFTEADERIAKLSPEERVAAEFELFSPMESTAVLAEFPAPKSHSSEPIPEFLPQFLPNAAASPSAPPPAAMSVPVAKIEIPPGTQPLNIDAGTAAALAVNAAASATAASAASASSAAAATSAASAAATAAASAAASAIAIISSPSETKTSSPLAPSESVPKGSSPPPRRRTPRAAAVTAMPGEHIAEATDAELVGLCLTPESWFRVYDSKNGQTLWLKVASYYPERGSVGFNGFDAKKSMSMRVSRLLDDLVSGRSEPVNASPVQQRALAELRARRKKAG